MIANSRRILLLGATGQLGSQLRQRLPEVGRVFATARRAETGIQALDLTDFEQLRACIREIRPALIVNAAAYTKVDQAEAEPGQADAVNVGAVRVIQEEAERGGAAILHYSTEYVFEGTGNQPYAENDPPLPQSVYGRTKLAGEQLLGKGAVPFLVLRTSWLYGESGENFISKILRAAAKLETLHVVNDQIGAPTSTRFLAEATAQLLSHGDGNWAQLFRERGGLLHVCCSGEVSRYSWALSIVDRARRSGHSLAVRNIEAVPTSHFPTPAVRPLNSRLDCPRLRRLFDLAPPEWDVEFGNASPSCCH
jgi:dTDP-4-dehydrorhamnose reductase